MATAFIKSPCELNYGDYVDLFLDRFEAFAMLWTCQRSNSRTYLAEEVLVPDRVSLW